MHVVTCTCMYKGVQSKYRLQHTGNWPAAAWPARRLCYRPTVFFRHLRLAFPSRKEKFGAPSTKLLLFPFLLTFPKTVRNSSTLNCVGRTVIVSSYLFSKPVTCLVTSCSMANVELLSKGGAPPSAPSQWLTYSVQVHPSPIRSQRPSATRPSSSGFKSQTSVQPNSSPHKEPIAIWIRSL